MDLAALLAIFLLAGLVKGVLGMGLPTVAIGMLSLLMTPAEASVLLLVPSLLTNVWQMIDGKQLGSLLKRFWPLLLTTFVLTVAASRFLVDGETVWVSRALGVCLIAYGVLGFLPQRLKLPTRGERWQSALAGAVTGGVTGLTGVFVVPVVPYLQARGLDRHALTQALGISFTCSTLALAVGLALHGAFKFDAVGQSWLMVLPAVLGMLLGQKIRDRLSEQTFRRCLFAGLILLGLHALL